MTSDVIISQDRMYRYLLWRVWDMEKPMLAWIMLNPSTANKDVNDATIRTIIGLAQRWNYGGITVGNLFAFRATHPFDLMEQAAPIGPDNDMYLDRLLRHHNTIVLAWGSKGVFLDRDLEVLAKIKESEQNIMCLGYTRTGQPWHPLATIGPVRLEKFDYARHRQVSKRS